MTFQMRYKEETKGCGAGRSHSIYARVESMADLRKISSTAGPHQVKVM